MINKGQCKICGGWYQFELGTRRLPPHKHLKTGNDCRGRLPFVEPPCYQEWPEKSISRWDEWQGGLPELGKSS
jgi:hypothetical protein